MGPVPPVTFGGQAPGLGEHTKAVLAELGIDLATVSR
jgi:hypothetical protein